MTKDIQAAVLRACARFINKRLDPMQKDLDDLKRKSIPSAPSFSDDIRRQIADQVTQSIDRSTLHGDKGDDGEGLSNALIDVSGELKIITTKGRTIEVGKVVGRDAESISDERIASQVEKYLRANPPLKGDKGDTAAIEAPSVKDVALEVLRSDDLASAVELRVMEEVAKIPAPKDGKDGKEGANGKDGEKGERGENGCPGAKGERGENGERGLQGEKGNHGENGKHGDRGEKGESGDRGLDGVGLAGAMIDRDGSLTVTTSSGQAIKLGVVVGGNGKDGADFSDVEFSYDGERGLVIRGKGGEIVKRLPIPIDCGYWKNGTSYERGDIVTEGGTAYIALADTSTKPGLENKDWRIFARKGRDGKDGRNGIDKTATVAVNA